MLTQRFELLLAVFVVVYLLQVVNVVRRVRRSLNLPRTFHVEAFNNYHGWIITEFYHIHTHARSQLTSHKL